MNKGNIMSVEPHLFPELHEESVGLLMEAGKEWGVGNHMLCIYSGVSQIMETSVSQQSLGELSPPSSETGLQTSHFLTPLLGHWRALCPSERPSLKGMERTYWIHKCNSQYLWWFLPFIFTLLLVSEGTGIALVTSSSMAPLLPSIDQTFPSIQVLRVKVLITFGPGNGFLERNISKRIKHFFLGFKMKIGAFLLLYGGKIPWKHFSVVYINIRACIPLPKPSNHFQSERVFNNSTFNNSI